MLDLNLTPNTKINSKWVIDSHVNHITIKFLEKNIGEDLCGLELGRALRLDTKSMIHNKKNLQIGLHQN